MAKKKEPKLSEIMKRVRSCFANEDRKDALFRMVLVTNEVGDVEPFTYNLSKASEKKKQEALLAFGQAFVMLFSLSEVRTVNMTSARDKYLKNKKNDVERWPDTFSGHFIGVFKTVGDLAKFITHDPKLNPGARPHGSFEDEVFLFGRLFFYLRELTELCGLSPDDAIEIGLKNWEDADWRKREAAKGQKEDEVVGIAGSPGNRSGVAYVVSGENPIENFVAGMILVAPFASPELAIYFDRALAVVTDHGGKTSHAANLARERNLPCIVGTGNATAKIKNGDRISVDADVGTEKGVVKIFKK